MSLPQRPGISADWRLAEAYRGSAYVQALGSLNAVFELSGELVSRDPVSQVFRVTVSDSTFYVKRYFAGGKKLRRYLGRSRVCKEWKSLMHFAALGIPTPPLVAYGERRVLGLFRRGAVVTEQVDQAPSLAELAARGDPRIRDRRWLGCLLEQIASNTRRLHAGRFAHGDLNWRNILVKLSEPPQALFIDCPAGGRWFGPLLAYRKVKDLAHLDECARTYLSRAQRLRFFLLYTGRRRLEGADRRLIMRVLRYGEYLDCKDRLLGLSLAASELSAWISSLVGSIPSVVPSDRSPPHRNSRRS